MCMLLVDLSWTRTEFQNITPKIICKITFALILIFRPLIIWSNEPLLDFRFDAIVSADAFEKLKPAPDIFLAASKILGVDTNEVIYLANQNG